MLSFLKGRGFFFFLCRTTDNAICIELTKVEKIGSFISNRLGIKSLHDYLTVSYYIYGIIFTVAKQDEVYFGFR